MKQLTIRLMQVEAQMDALDGKLNWTKQDVMRYNGLEREWIELRNRLGYC